jgi:hypothetical protein
MMSEKEAPQLMFELARPDEGRAGIGALLAVGLYLVELIFLVLSMADSVASEHRDITIAALSAPLLQALYIVPAYLVLKSSGKSATGNGLLGGAIVMAVIHYAIAGFIALAG